MRLSHTGRLLVASLCTFWCVSPCAAEVLVSQDLGASAYTASSQWESEPKDAFDGTLDFAWNAGNYPVQWLEVDLQQPRDLTSFKLFVDQLPDADTIHELWLSNSAIHDDLSGATLIHTFAGFTSNLDVLTLALASPVSAQFVQIRTTDSPSWVAWKEVQVFASAIPEPTTFALAAAGVLGLVMSRRRRSRFAPRLGVVVALAACATFLQAQTVAHAATVRTVALTGQQAPGTPSGVNFIFSDIFIVGAPVLNDAGQTAFTTVLTGTGVDNTNDQGIWSEGSGSLALVARRGSQAPGTPSGVNFISFLNLSVAPVLNDAGQTAFTAGFTDGSHGIWSEGSGSLTLVAREGDHAPGTPSAVYFSFQSLALNNAGQIAFTARLSGSGGGIWSEGAGSLTLVALSGDHAPPGTPSGVDYSTTAVGPFGPAILNDVGQIAFRAFLIGSGVDATNNQGIWSDRSGSLALVARSGTQAPGTASGVNYRSVAQPALNDAGQTAFSAFLIGSGVDATNNQGIWSNSSGSLALVARSGDHAPGTPSGVNYSMLFVSPVLNDAGQTAFNATLTGSGVDSTNNTGIWSEGSGSLALVARTGDHAPGTPSGVNFSGLSNLNGSSVLNDAGQIAFAADLTGSGVDFTNRSGIWASDRTGVLQLIARTGDPLEVAPGDFRTISGVRFFDSLPNSDRQFKLNNLGQLVFSAYFTDGTGGIFVSNLVAVPEPATIVLAACGLVMVVLPWIRRRSVR